MSGLGPVGGPLEPDLAIGGRGSHLFGGLRQGGPRSLLLATASTLFVFAVLALVIVNSPGWPAARQAFFDQDEFARSFPRIARAFVSNIEIFLVAEVCILVFALLLAVMRLATGPVFAPFRLLSLAYTDFFRGVPGILIVYMLGFGMPSLELPGLPIDPWFWGVTSLVLVYSAYVSEVYRAGIESIHPSQEAAARSLGLSRGQAMRYVVLPQAVRRVIPPLLNDFIGLQKDSAFVAFLGPVEAFRTAQIFSSADFNLTPYVVTAIFFLALTVPMVRLVDWLVARDRRRYLAGAR